MIAAAVVPYLQHLEIVEIRRPDNPFDFDVTPASAAAVAHEMLTEMLGVDSSPKDAKDVVIARLCVWGLLYSWTREAHMPPQVARRIADAGAIEFLWLCEPVGHA
jgi:hypothetical protein